MISAFDYLRAYEAQKDAIHEAIARVIGSGQLILGPELAELEREFAAFTGAPFGVGVACGTDALMLALRALDIGSGDEVITVPNTAVATVAAIRATGAAVRLVDVRETDLLVDADRLQQAVGPRTRAVVPVHLFGQAADMQAVMDIANRHGLAVVGDCAQAHGTKLEEKHVGTFGRIGCFSYYPTKNLGAYGDAGMCVTSDQQLWELLRQLRMYGFRGDGI